MGKIQAGTFNAKIVDHGVSVKEDKAPQAVICFEVNDRTDHKPIINWYGSFHENAKKYTVETLIQCGFKSNNPMDLQRFINENEPLKPIVLDEESDFELVLENNTYNDKTSVRIKYINSPGNNRLRKEVDSNVFTGMNLDGMFMSERKKQGLKTTELSDDNMPF